MRIVINLTPHGVKIGDIEYPPSGMVARVRETITARSRGEFPYRFYRVVLGEVEGLPPMEAGTIYIVSRQVAEKTPRLDIYFPVGLIRDSEGRVTGAEGLGFF